MSHAFVSINGHDLLLFNFQTKLDIINRIRMCFTQFYRKVSYMYMIGILIYYIYFKFFEV